MKCPNCQREIELHDDGNYLNATCVYCGARYLREKTFNEKFDWEKYRTEVAMTAMQAIISNEKQLHAKLEEAIDFGDTPHRLIAESAIKFADTLIEELKKGE